MSDDRQQSSALLKQFEEHLAKASYSASCSARYLAVASNFLQYIEYGEDGRIVKQFSWVTDLPITRENAPLLVQGARCRHDITIEISGATPYTVAVYQVVIGDWLMGVL